MKNESTYRITVILLLAGILAVQSAVLLRIQKPVTMADLRKNGLTPQQRTALLLKIPLVRVNGSVDVDVQNPSLGVDVVGQPIQVEISR